MVYNCKTDMKRPPIDSEPTRANKPGFAPELVARAYFNGNTALPQRHGAIKSAVMVGAILYAGDNVERWREVQSNPLSTDQIAEITPHMNGGHLSTRAPLYTQNYFGKAREQILRRVDGQLEIKPDDFLNEHYPKFIGMSLGALKEIIHSVNSATHPRTGTRFISEADLAMFADFFSPRASAETRDKAFVVRKLVGVPINVLNDPKNQALLLEYKQLLIKSRGFDNYGLEKTIRMKEIMAILYGQMVNQATIFARGRGRLQGQLHYILTESEATEIVHHIFRPESRR